MDDYHWALEQCAALEGDSHLEDLPGASFDGLLEEIDSFARSRSAAENPANLAGLQRYYEVRFLPQPLEREWLRRHDPELVTHARNERMADYAVSHNEDAAEVHLIVGAAHQPGVRYSLERHRDGERRLDGFELLG